MKFSLNVGGLYVPISQGYDAAYEFDARFEVANWTEAVANIGEKFGIDIGASIFPMSQLEIYASYGSFGGTALGDYSFTLPHQWWGEEPQTASIAEVENEFKATVISIGLAFHPEIVGKIKPYFGAGLSSVTVKMDLLDKVSVVEYYEDIWYYTWDDYYWEWNLRTEPDYNFEITKIGFTEESETVWGFHAKAGVNFEVAKNISIFVEGRYLSATAKFERPDVDFKVDYTGYWADYLDGELWGDGTWEGSYEAELELDDELEVKVGGIQGIVGIKISF